MTKLLIAACAVLISLQAPLSAQESKDHNPRSWLAEHPFNNSGPTIDSQEPILIQRQPKVQPHRPSADNLPAQELDNKYNVPVQPKLLTPDRPDCDGRPASESKSDGLLARFPAIHLALGEKLPAPPANLKRPTIAPHTQQLPHALPAPPAVGTRNRPVPGNFNGRWVLPNQTSFYRGFYYNRLWFGHQFYAYQNFGPTEYYYFASGGYWWGPGLGYSWQRPNVQGVITIAVIEVVTVPVWNQWTRTWVLQQRQVLWYYNAYWYPNLNCWVYQDFRGVIHAVRW